MPMPQEQTATPVVVPQAPPAPPAAATPAAPAAATPNPVRFTLTGGSPQQVYQGAVSQRQELRRTRETVEAERRQLSRDLQNPMVDGANKAGLEARITLLDKRLIELDQQIAQADASVATAAGIPGAIPPRGPDPIVDDDLVSFLAVVLVFAVIVPITVAHVRRIWKRAGAAVSAVPQSLLDRFARLENNVDAMAIEMERVSEGQRFMTKLFAEQGARGLGQGAAEPVRVAERDQQLERLTPR